MATLSNSTVLQKFGSDSVSVTRSMLRSSPLRVAAFVVIASLAIGGIFYEANAQATPLQYSMRATGGKVPIASAVAGSKSSNGSSTAAIPMHAVHIANDGLTYVQGASVASIGNGTISIALAWGGATFNWTVTTNSNTKFYSKSGEKGTIEGIQVGDYIDVTGALAQGGATPIIAAQFIRE